MEVLPAPLKQLKGGQLHFSTGWTLDKRVIMAVVNRRLALSCPIMERGMPSIAAQTGPQNTNQAAYWPFSVLKVLKQPQPFKKNKTNFKFTHHKFQRLSPT